MDYLKRAGQIAEGFEFYSKLHDNELSPKEEVSFDAIAAYALMSIAESLKTIAAQKDS